MELAESQIVVRFMRMRNVQFKGDDMQRHGGKYRRLFFFCWFFCSTYLFSPLEVFCRFKVHMKDESHPHARLLVQGDTRQALVCSGMAIR